MTDKAKELQTTITLVNDKLHFTGTVEGNAPVSIDYTPPLGDNLGYTSLELLLLSLSSCIGSNILVFLRRINKTIHACDIHGTGFRKETHPTAFREIQIAIHLKSPDVTAEDMNKVLKLSEDTFCPVWAMLKGNVDVKTTFTIEN